MSHKGRICGGAATEGEKRRRGKKPNKKRGVEEKHIYLPSARGKLAQWSSRSSQQQRPVARHTHPASLGLFFFFFFQGVYIPAARVTVVSAGTAETLSMHTDAKFTKKKTRYRRKSSGTTKTTSMFLQKFFFSSLFWNVFWAFFDSTVLLYVVSSGGGGRVGGPLQSRGQKTQHHTSLRNPLFVAIACLTPFPSPSFPHSRKGAQMHWVTHQGDVVWPLAQQCESK
jgi:hypothetical protein